MHWYSCPLLYSVVHLIVNLVLSNFSSRYHVLITRMVLLKPIIFLNYVEYRENYTLADEKAKKVKGCEVRPLRKINRKKIGKK